MTDAELVRHVFEYRRGRLYWRNGCHAGKRAGSQTIAGYRVVRFNGKNRPEHRVIWLWHYGEWPDPNKVVDHIDGRRNRNLINNLRVVSQKENRANRVGALIGDRPWKGY